MYMKRLNAPTEKDAALEEVKPKRDLMRAEVINLIYLDGRARSTDPDDGHSSGDNRLAVRYSRVYACRVSVCTDRIAMCLRGLIHTNGAFPPHSKPVFTCKICSRIEIDDSGGIGIAGVFARYSWSMSKEEEADFSRLGLGIVGILAMEEMQSMGHVGQDRAKAGRMA
jgi:hypothetical protein